MQLPAYVNIVTEKGTADQAVVTWDTESPVDGSYDPSVLTEQTVTLRGVVTCPDKVDPNGMDLTTGITITISAAGIVGAPVASVEVGTYTKNQSVALTSTTDGQRFTIQQTEVHRQSRMRHRLEQHWNIQIQYPLQEWKGRVLQ